MFDAELVSRFEWLRHINHGDLATPPLFMVFDLLQLGDKDCRLEPLKVRRRALEKLIKGRRSSCRRAGSVRTDLLRGLRFCIVAMRAWW